MNKSNQIMLLLAVLLLVLSPGFANAHCDTMSGPVVVTAKAALEKGDVTPVLKWVQKENEPEIRDLFKKTLTVRSKGPEAKDLADQYFFETLVRIHREGEGAPYTGLKPSGQVEPSIAAADKAIDSGSVDNLVKMITDASAAGIRERYTKVRETKKHADDSVDAGRKFVAAYVDFTHYVEKLDLTAASAAHHESVQESPVKQEHQHQGH